MRLLGQAFVSLVHLPQLLTMLASDSDKETCTESLLQISSSVKTSRCDTETTKDLERLGSSKGHLLLQVAARTGEVSNYHPSDEDNSERLPRRSSNSLAQHEGRRSSSTREDDAEADEPDEPKAKAKSDGKEEPNPKEDKTKDDEDQKALTEKPEVSGGARIAPFGKEDTARELQSHAARTQDTLVDAIENAEVAEIKRSIFRALTRLRAAEIKEFDTIARLETQAIDEYNDNHHYRAENPLDYIHSSEEAVKTDKYTSFHD
mmetsp:Transcript_92626/g.146434  ORF Transcript_92626/g.146434 Transcript_92626/m.146434 type:complete len:262 (-) Transcript_92626:73-858(-)